MKKQTAPKKAAATEKTAAPAVEVKAETSVKAAEVKAAGTVAVKTEAAPAPRDNGCKDHPCSGKKDCGGEKACRGKEDRGCQGGRPEEADRAHHHGRLRHRQ